jgi:hypothetical protein
MKPYQGPGDFEDYLVAQSSIPAHYFNQVLKTTAAHRAAPTIKLRPMTIAAVF